MKWLKYMLLVVWCMASWPCAHSRVAECHEHSAAQDAGLCAMDVHDCHCHSCEKLPCLGKTSEVHPRSSLCDAMPIEPPRTPILVFTEARSSLPPVPTVRDSRLVSLRSVRLLI